MSLDDRIEHLIRQRTNEIQARIDAVHGELHDVRRKLDELMASEKLRQFPSETPPVVPKGSPAKTAPYKAVRR